MRYAALVFLIFSACSDTVIVKAVPALCGNGIVEDDEACDDGNEQATDECTNDCAVARCGDGVTRMDRNANHDDFEQCDDGNDSDRDACRTSCRAAVCGDAIVRMDVSEGEPSFEECDDGNTDELDGCTRNCDTGVDSDGDTIIDPIDNCPNTPNTDQADSDGDGAGDVCDPNPQRRDFKLRSRLDVSSSGRALGDEHRLHGISGSSAPAQGVNREFRLRSSVKLGGTP
jgi:cysteine-rich repeat protein